MEQEYSYTKDYVFEKSDCPEGYLEDLSKYLTENQYTADENGEFQLTELLFSESICKLHDIPCCVYFHYFIKGDIDELNTKFLEYLISDKGDIDINDNEIKSITDYIKKQQESIYDTKTTFSETKKAIFMILCLSNGEMPVFIDDVGSKLTLKREDNKNICFKTDNYIK